MQSSLFRRPLVGCVSAAACLTLFGCGGASSSSPTANEAPASAGSAGSPSTVVAGSTSNSPPNASGAGGSVHVEPAGGRGGTSTSGSGGPQGGSAGTGDGIDFSHGTRVVFPQRNYQGASIGTDFEAMNADDPINLVVDAPLVDAPTYARQFEVSFGPNWIAVGHCYERKAKFAPTTVEVIPDTGRTGAHLEIELVDGHYRLTHDGPGTHDVHVTGTLHVEATDLAQVCAPNFPKTAVDIPVTLTSHINIQHLGSIEAEPGFGCGSSPVMLSGRSFEVLWLSLLNDSGQAITGNNVYSDNPVDIVVETEKAAVVAEAGSGFATYGLIVTGEPQMVRVSTSYGTLFTYQLANLAMIDDWEVKFWSRDSQDAKSATYPMAMDMMPAVTPGKELGATATLKIGGSPLCGPTLASDFTTSLPTPNACKVQLQNSNWNAGTPGFLATFVEPAGTCELDLSVPAANGAHGLKKHLSAILAPAK